MQFNVITLFPEVIHPYCQTSIVGRAVKSGLVQVTTANPRDFTHDVHHKVDDTPYGGGAGMVMMCEPIMAAYESLLPLSQNSGVILTTPVGPLFNQSMAKAWSKLDQLVILCGHYEGIDARILDLIPDIQPVSLGDFVLTGGELPALVMIDAVSRLLPGVVGKEQSIEAESYSTGLLEHPHYTRPAEYRGLRVPDVLLSGHHAEIEKWRHQQSLALTWRYRPDLLAHYPLSPSDEQLLSQLTQSRATEEPLQKGNR